MPIECFCCRGYYHEWVKVDVSPDKLFSSRGWEPNEFEKLYVERLADDISKNGMKHPIVINELYHILDGHNRHAVAKMMNWETIECSMVKLHLPDIKKDG
jgi:ParB-like chromosome segregation protein Spo0J